MLILLIVFVAGGYLALHEIGAFFAFTHPVLTLCEVLAALLAYHYGREWIDRRERDKTGEWKRTSQVARPMDNAKIAYIAWDANRAYCAAIHDRPQLHWLLIDDWERESAIAGVAYHREHPEATDAECHAERLKHETAEGWRYGAVHDDGAKLSPYMVPFEGLPSSQQVKYRLFRAVVRALIEAD